MIGEAGVVPATTVGLLANARTKIIRNLGMAHLMSRPREAEDLYAYADPSPSRDESHHECSVAQTFSQRKPGFETQSSWRRLWTERCRVRGRVREENYSPFGPMPPARPSERRVRTRGDRFSAAPIEILSKTIALLECAATPIPPAACRLSLQPHGQPCGRVPRTMEEARLSSVLAPRSVLYLSAEKRARRDLIDHVNVSTIR